MAAPRLRAPLNDAEQAKAEGRTESPKLRTVPSKCARTGPRAGALANARAGRSKRAPVLGSVPIAGSRVGAQLRRIGSQGKSVLKSATAAVVKRGGKRGQLAP